MRRTSRSRSCSALPRAGRPGRSIYASRNRDDLPSELVSGRGFIAAEAAQQCDECGKVDELRPYGPGGAKVCHPCLSSHPEWKEEAEARTAHRLWGEPIPERFLTS